MGAPSVTYTLNNGDVADAAKLNTNFGDLINGASDGTKDYTIAALTTKGNTVLGDAATDTLTVTAMVASDLIPSANNSKDLGSAAAKWAELHAVTCNLDGAVTINESGSDVDFRVEGDTDANMLFVDASADRLGIGTNAPEEKVHMYTASGSIFNRVQSASLGTTDIASHFIYAKRTGGSYRYAGVGVGKTANITEACGYLDLTTQDGVETYFWQDDSDVFRLSNSYQHIGRSDVGTIVGSQTSDRRLKKDITEINYGLETVMNLNPVKFKMYDVNQIGFIAQDVLSVVPEAVYDTKMDIDGTDNTKLCVEYHQIIPILTKAIQEQQAIILDLKSRIETLEA